MTGRGTFGAGLQKADDRFGIGSGAELRLSPAKVKLDDRRHSK